MRRRWGNAPAALVALLWAGLLAVGAAADTRDKFAVSGQALRYDTEAAPGVREITQADIGYLRKMLRARPDIDTLILNSTGGDYYAALEMARIVVDAEIDTVIDGECSSSCTLIFLGGEGRQLQRGSLIGFHQTSWTAEGIEGFYDANQSHYGWEDPFDLAQWLYRDTQDEVRRHLAFMFERGVAPDFALETIRDQGDDLWYPDRGALERAGVLRERP